jgi:hypothetical protein
VESIFRVVSATLRLRIIQKPRRFEIIVPRNIDMRFALTELEATLVYQILNDTVRGLEVNNPRHPELSKTKFLADKLWSQMHDEQAEVADPDRFKYETSK